MPANAPESKECYECPTCGDSFDTENGKKIHHSRKHGESIAETRVCDQCGDEYRPNDPDARFCSNSCYAEWQSDNLTGADNPNSSERAELVCEVCEETFNVPPSRSGARFCSNRCRGQWQSDAWTQEDNPNGGEWHTLECDRCGDQFRRPDYYLSLYNPQYCPDCWEKPECTCEVCGERFKVPKGREESARFCSRACTGEWLSGRFTGDSHPRWTGGQAKYGSGWNEEKKERVRERDGRRCRDCGLPEREHIIRHGCKLHVHHITPARSFDDDERRNDTDNLITLCAPCHLGKWEPMQPLQPVIEE